MIATMAMTIKSFLFGEDLVHWQIACDAQEPTRVLPSVDISDEWIRAKLAPDVYMYYDAANYCPREFNRLASQVSDMQIFGTALFITHPQADFVLQCQRAPALPDRYRLERPEIPCSQ